MKEKVLEIMQGINPEVQDGKDLIEAEIVDSFTVMNIVMELEEAFGFEIDPEDIIEENFKTVDAVVALAKKTLG